MRKVYSPDLFGSTPTWRAEAACRNSDSPELFFPHSTSQMRDGAAGARLYCNTCPVVYECLKEALDGNEYGTWGGMTHHERIRLRTRIKPSDYATVGKLRETLEVTLPRCVDCDRHLKPKAEGRCTECYRVYVKAEAAAEALRIESFCSENDCGADVHAKGKCVKHYGADRRNAAKEAA